MHLNYLFASRKLILISLLTSLLLASCSSNITHQQSKQSSRLSALENNGKSVAQLLAIATRQNNHQQSEQALGSLITAAQQYVNTQQPTQAVWLTNSIKPMIDAPVQQLALLLIQARAWQQLNNNEQAWQALTLAKPLVVNQSSAEQSYFQLVSKVQQARNYPVAALDAKMHWLALTQDVDPVMLQTVWYQLNQLSNWQLEQLKQLAPPQFYGWQQLLFIAHNFGANKARFAQHVEQWRRANRQHLANAIINELLAENQALAVTNIQQIAVILPLSGKQQVAGEAAQQGILAAYPNNNTTQLIFIDSNQVDMNTLAEQLNSQHIDFVIGPLLIKHVDQYINQPALTLPTLLLNSPTTAQLKNNQVVFSMRPEDEAIQAADTLSHRHYQHPLILSDHNEISQRITQTFVNEWSKYNDNQPQVVYIQANGSMQASVQHSLDVDLSRQRIHQLRQIIKAPLKTETRNRRDIDMIYIVGSPRETRLLKPYIDVNISPFAKLIPIFASSRSHSARQDRKGTRDLSGLSFTEMPWLLTDGSQNQSLAEINLKLWPERSDILQRIFALGYDSFSLVNKIQLMQQVNYIRHYGLTGIIQLTPQQILTRTLLWGRYRHNTVQQITMKAS